ncbi:DJ-1/PfpI family protein [Candidatus Leptofilum sp.]|uniref:DJ-1/PfpI family protein n=1 Tax=Candidatus Leptofilum sp. TaxID=3241576 RepID=UPI003B5B39C2
MKTTSKSFSQKRAIVLIAPKFDEEMVVNCLYQMRQRGTAVDLVGTPSNLVVGSAGLVVQPDYSLAQLHTIANQRLQLIIIPGKATCATNLLSDPRVHQVIQDNFKNGGFVATSSPIVPQILSSIGLIQSDTTPRLLTKSSQNMQDFIQTLFAHLNS